MQSKVKLVEERLARLNKQHVRRGVWEEQSSFANQIAPNSLSHRT